MKFIVPFVSLLIFTFATTVPPIKPTCESCVRLVQHFAALRCNDTMYTIDDVAEEVHKKICPLYAGGSKQCAEKARTLAVTLFLKINKNAKAKRACEDVELC